MPGNLHRNLFVFKDGGCIIRQGRPMIWHFEGALLERSKTSRLRVAFLGSDDFSVPSLEACLAGAEVVAVYTQPDRRSGRGRKKLAGSPVKQLAAARGLHIEQPEGFDKACVEKLRGFAAELMVVAAYGQILPAAALAAARVDSINVHASILPRHRGASPVAAAILAGDAEAGVTIMKMKPAVDAGEIICIGEERRRAQKAVPIAEDENAGELSARLARIGGELAAEVLAAFADGSVTYEKQDGTRATYAPMMQKSDGRIDWSRPADVVLRHIRAMTPWPGAYTYLHASGTEPTRIVVLDARACEARSEAGPGRVGVLDAARLVVETGSGCVELGRIKPADRKALGAAEFVRGCRALREGSGRSGDCWLGDA